MATEFTLIWRGHRGIVFVKGILVEPVQLYH